MEKREEALAAAKERFEADNEAERAEEAKRGSPEVAEANEDDEEEDDGPEFDVEEFDAKFDDENPPIEIPPEVIDDVDNDFNIEIEEEEERND